jgi:hypothetical protein
VLNVQDISLRGRFRTTGTDAFKSSVLDELGHRAQQARKRGEASGHAYHSEGHAAALELLAAGISALDSAHPSVAVLRELQQSLHPVSERWTPSPEQASVLDRNGSDFRGAVPADVALAELAIAGVEDLREHRGQHERDLNDRLRKAEAEAAKVAPLEERTEVAENTAAEARHEVERLRTELALSEAELHVARNIASRPETTEAEVEPDEEPTEDEPKKTRRRVKA